VLKLETETKARIKALQNAGCHGIADIEAGRYHAFDSPVELDRHLGHAAGWRAVSQGPTERWMTEEVDG
jgi:hypothetical protein